MPSARMRDGGQCSVVSDTSQLVNYVDYEAKGCIVSGDRRDVWDHRAQNIYTLD